MSTLHSTVTPTSAAAAAATTAGQNWSLMGNSTCLSPDNPNAVWLYCPSEAAAILFAILFLTSTCVNIWVAVKYKMPWLTVLIMGAAWEFFGFTARAIATQFQESLILYTTQTLFILLAPLWINAFVYMFFARMVHYFDPSQKVGRLPATKLGPTLIGLDIVTFLVQVNGAAELSDSDQSAATMGKNIYMTGLGVQQALIFVVTYFVYKFHQRVKANAVPRSTHWNPSIYLIYITLALITFRIIFRIVEFSQGFTAPVANTESYQYLFDALLMLNATIIWIIWTPGKVLVDREGLFPTKAEKKATKALLKAQKQAKKEGRDLSTEDWKPNYDISAPFNPADYQQPGSTVKNPAFGAAASFANAEHEERGAHYAANNPYAAGLQRERSF